MTALLLPMAIGMLVGWFARRAWDHRNVEFYRMQAEASYRDMRGFYPTLPNEIPPEPPQDRVFEALTRKDLEQMFDGKTTREAKAIAKPHIGHWVKLSALIDDIDEIDLGGGCSVWLGDGEPEAVSWVSLSFDEEWKRTITSKKRGDQLTVIGQIDSLERWHLTLTRCELIQPD